MIFVVGFRAGGAPAADQFSCSFSRWNPCALRSRDSEALEYFKEHLQDKLRAASERGHAGLFAGQALVAGRRGFFVCHPHAGERRRRQAGRGELCAGLAGDAGIFPPSARSFSTARRTRNGSSRWRLFLKLIVLPFRPVTAVLVFFESLVEIGSGENGSEKPAAPGEEIDALITAGEEEGIIEKEGQPP